MGGLNNPCGMVVEHKPTLISQTHRRWIYRVWRHTSNIIIAVTSHGQVAPSEHSLSFKRSHTSEDSIYLEFVV